jgi:hypothetical protein
MAPANRILVALSDVHGLDAAMPPKLMVPAEGQWLLFAGDIAVRSKLRWDHWVRWLASHPHR